jgi:hypothetical protein
MALLYTSPHLRISLLSNADHLALEVAWQNQPSGTELQQGSIQAMLRAQRHRVSAWISDDLALGPLSEADAQWAGTMLRSLHQDLGISRFALLESASTHNRRLLQPHVTRYATPDAPIQLQRVTDLAQARAWALS